MSGLGINVYFEAQGRYPNYPMSYAHLGLSSYWVAVKGLELNYQKRDMGDCQNYGPFLGPLN